MVDERDFLSFVAGLFEVPSETLSLETAYESIPQWDSVMHLRLMMEVGAAYGVDIPLDEIPNLKTLGAIYSKLNG
ncbi:MAG: acyl carrier protein [Kiritimatiellae bacterium]|nr:acyl carrier protein [Kiritimatiellia bacterium]